MKREKNKRKSVMAILFAVAMIASAVIVISPVMANNNAPSERPLPPTTPPAISLAPGYCPSYGGSHLYENIQSVSYAQKPGETLTITVNIWIANPSNCVAGEPCPEYDDSPEYINAWIDWDGDGVFASDERVLDAALTGYLGINYHGTMSTSDIVTIPADAVSSTWMRVNLGWDHDPNDPCEESWSWGDVVDKEVKIVTYKVGEIDAKADINILDNAGNSITDPIWMIDAAGNVIEDEPIADIKRGYFKIKATVYMFEDGVKSQKPNWAPTKVKCDWSIFSTLLPGTAAETSGSGEFSGWSGEFKVTVPQKVGQYYLFLKFTFYKDGNQIGGEQTTGPHKLYVTAGAPKADVSPPKERWLEVATDWGKDAKTEKEAAAKVLDKEYSNPFSWVYKDQGANWENMIDTTPGDQTNCYKFAEVWVKLTRVLGLDSTDSEYDPAEAFVTSLKAALDGNYDANARNRALADPSDPLKGRDRWRFGAHDVGRFDGKYYDPTFGLKEYTNVEKNVYAKSTSATASQDGFTWRIYERLDDPTNFIKVRGTTSRTPNNWRICEYKNSPSFQANNPSGATLIGISSDSGLDTDGDGLFNYLKVNMEIEVTEPDDYAIDSILRYGDTLISAGSLDLGFGVGNEFSSTAPETILYLPAGTNIVPLYFRGKDIYESGIDGDYTLDIILIRAAGQVDEKSFNTASYNHGQFQGLTLEVISITDFGSDVDLDGQFDFLTVQIDFNVLRDAFFKIDGVLLGEKTIDSSSASTYLTQGPTTVFMNFDGSKIRKSRINGPYNLELFLADENYNRIVFTTTSSYDYTQFKKPSTEFTGTYSDYGTDTDGDGRYNYLTAEVGVKVTVPGTYTILGWLSDSSEESDIIWDSSDLYLDASVQSMQLNFDGTAIYKHGTDGPYSLSYFALSDENGNLVDYRHDAYTTSAYSYTDFQKPEGLLVELTGSYNDYATDIDSDGVFDYLTVDVEVMLANPGYCIIKARLMDINGEEIVWAENTAYLEADTPQIIPLNFDGTAIYNHGVNGPYYLRDVYIYHTGDPYQPDYVYDACTTAPYSYTEFGKMCGDANCDGKVTMSDVRKVFNRYLDPNYPLDSPWAADVNCDGEVTMSDVRKVFNRYLDPGYELNCCCGSGVDSAWVGG